MFEQHLSHCAMTNKQQQDDFRGFMHESQIPTPKFHPVIIPKQEMKNDMYPIRWPPYSNNDVEKRIDNVLGPLSIFAPFPHENEPEHEELELERPVTPIDKEIKAQPSSFDQLAKYVRRRIAAKPEVAHLSLEDQQNLAGIIMGEVNSIWPDIRKQIDDPFLKAEENKELNRRIAVYIVTVCEQLFSHYLNKAQVLNSRGVFSGPANMSRLKAQLALEANKFLNILTIRRYIVADMRKKGDGETADSEEFYASQPPKPKETQSFGQLSYEGLIQSSRPKSKTKTFRSRTMNHDIREMTSNMPTLDTSKLMDLVAELPDRVMSSLAEDGYSSVSRTSGRQSKTSGSSEEQESRRKVLLKRSGSDPCLLDGETLLEEMGISPRVRHDPLIKYELDFLHRERELLTQERQVEERPKMGSREYAAEDLRRLINRPDESNQEVEEDLPPLLQAIIRNSRHDGLKERMERKLKELEEKQRRREEEEHVEVREPVHPQPATINSQLSDKLTVRTSDVRVSERVCMSSITLNRYATVYNDLIEEVDPVTVKALDRNLFLSDEIREVYKEIMKTVPQDHLELEDDPMVVGAAEDISLSGVMASSTLSKKPVERVINPTLRATQDPPWGQTDPKQWVKTPSNPPKNFQGENTFAPLTPNPEKIHAVFNNPSKLVPGTTSADNMPSFVAENLARTYASWLQWWKSTVTSDDYMKFLSTQETDFMGVLFHFYDSEDDDNDDESVMGSARGTQAGGFRLQQGGARPPPSRRSRARSSHSGKAAEQREREKKIAELKAQKTEFKEGFWNVNSVLMGGLGKEPLLEDKEDEANKKRTKQVEVSSAAKTLRERAALARQARMMEKSRDTSRASGRMTGTTNKSDEVIQKPLTPQERLERVWACLQMTDSMKLDMAIKYSCNEFFSRLDEVMEKWENAADLIIKRENLLERLEKFERSASDPNRFFEKGHKRSSVVRLGEARQRSSFYKKIDALDVEIKAELDHVKERFNDTITFKGRVYADKMKWDRVEMLYWLQEERKQHAVQYESSLRQVPLPLRPAQLTPLHINT